MAAPGGVGRPASSPFTPQSRSIVGILVLGPVDREEQEAQKGVAADRLRVARRVTHRVEPGPSVPDRPLRSDRWPAEMLSSAIGSAWKAWASVLLFGGDGAGEGVEVGDAVARGRTSWWRELGQSDRGPAGDWPACAPISLSSEARSVLTAARLLANAWYVPVYWDATWLRLPRLSNRAVS